MSGWVRALNRNVADEVDLVARRMRQTLVEVLGARRGTRMYTLKWLRQRVLQHLDQLDGEVFVVEEGGELVGHAIVRVEEGVGLFSTVFVDPAYRGRGLARQLLAQGEQWMLARQMTEGVTYTAETNDKLRRLFESCGYRVVEQCGEFIQLRRALV